MILRFYPTKDATIYEQYPQKNTGLDAVLELNKVIIGSGSYNSRILLNFDYTQISSSIVSLGYNPNNFIYNLKLYVTEADEIPLDYSLYAYLLSDSWNMGIGRYSNYPETTDGVSWYYRQTADDIATSWKTGSFTTLTTGSWSVTKGGGTWYTSSVASQSFSYTTADVDMNITSLINKIQSGSVINNGIVIKKSDADESSSSMFGSLRFFSKDTHTVYIPVIEAKYDDSVSTGNLDLINTDEDCVLVMSNLKPSYTEDSRPKIRIAARYRYPVQTFSTASEYLQGYKLPTGSQYAIGSAHSDDVIIDYSNYTKISNDANGNYINLHLDSFQPERYYKLMIKVPNSGSANSYQVFDRKWIFKVTRSN